MSNKERTSENTLGQVSLPKELLARSKAYAKKKGLPWATWVRTLIIQEIDKSGKLETEEDDPGHFRVPTGKQTVGASGFTLRK